MVSAFSFHYHECAAQRNDLGMKLHSKVTLTCVIFSPIFFFYARVGSGVHDTGMWHHSMVAAIFM